MSTSGDVAHALVGIIGDAARVSTSAAALRQHGEDLTYHPLRHPDAVVYPESREEVAAVVRFANAAGIPIVPFGAGTSLEGHVIPVAGGISLDLSRIDGVEVDPTAMTATAGAGLLRSELERRAGAHGLFFPVDPGADATLGGMAATNASGTTTVRYGGMRSHVLELEVVLADGAIIRTGSRARKTSAGYNLTGLFIGSEGTLGVITELTVRLHGIPEHIVAARATFPDVDAAVRTATTLVAAGAPVMRLELLDSHTVRAINRYKDTSYPEAATLFLEFGGTAGAVAGEVDEAREAARLEGAMSFEVERKTERRARLWAARHHAALALVEMAPAGRRLKVTDVCVPISALAESIREARQLCDARSLDAAIIGHVGDGNYHIVFTLDPDDASQVADAEALNAEIVDRALTVGGTCTGEHGIGLGKIDYLEREHSSSIGTMRAIKAALDPTGILNPGKVLRPEFAARR